jgi:hypothetical protein
LEIHAHCTETRYQLVLRHPAQEIFLNQQGINGCDKRLEIKIPVFWHFNHLNLPVFNHAVSWPSYLEINDSFDSVYKRGYSIL